MRGEVHDRLVHGVEGPVVDDGADAAANAAGIGSLRHLVADQDPGKVGKLEQRGERLGQPRGALGPGGKGREHADERARVANRSLGERRRSEALVELAIWPCGAGREGFDPRPFRCATAELLAAAG